MKKKSNYFFIFISSLLLIGVHAAYVMAAEDLQYWSSYTISHKISDHLSLFLNPSWRFKDDLGELRYWESRQGVALKLDDHWSVNLHFLHGENKNSASKWIDENRIELQPTFKWTWRELGFADRVRSEYRIVDGTEKWRFRNRLHISKSVKVFGHTIKPYVSEEVFYDDSVDKVNQSRAALGFEKKISDQLGMDVYFMYKANRGSNDDWGGENVIGTSLKLSL